MTIEETRKKILEDEDFVMSEVRKLRYLYGLKREIRYALKRKEEVYTESVAEHVYGMLILTNYFLPLESRKNTVDEAMIYQMITWHDTDEIETGDILGQLKTDEDRKREEEATRVVLTKIPASLRLAAEEIINEYNAKKTFEARFTRAIDKIEPLFEVMDENYKEIFRRNKTTRKQSDSIKQPYVQDFPCIKRFTDVISEYLDKHGFFVLEQ